MLRMWVRVIPQSIQITDIDDHHTEGNLEIIGATLTWEECTDKTEKLVSTEGRQQSLGEETDQGVTVAQQL